MKPVKVWALCEKVSGKWVPVSTLVFKKKESAIRIFQDRLLDSFFSGKGLELKKIDNPNPVLS
jgi:hypothetical protein